MVNNLYKLACYACQLFFVLLLLGSNNIKAQNISKYYTSSIQESGTLYFILSQSGFENKNLNGEFIYDITYSTSLDTAVLNFSYFDEFERVIDSIILVTADTKYPSKVSRIFVETTKSKWHYRYSTKFSFADLVAFFNQTLPPDIFIYTQEGLVKLKIKGRLWNKQSSITKKILTLIKYNKLN